MTSTQAEPGYPGLDSAYGDRASGPGLLPPQDVHAEQSVLGSMLLSKDAIGEAAEELDSRDFYRPAHETIYAAIIDLYGRGEPADAITVADELTKRGDLQRVGGQAYLHELINSVPVASNAGYYAHIVAERAVLRRLVEAGTRIVQMGQATGNGDVVDIINAAQAEVFAVSGGKDSEDYVPIGSVVEPTLDIIEAASGSSDDMTGVPTGFTDLDHLTNGLSAGQMIVIAARPAVGKSTLGLDIARSAAIEHHMSTVIFSLEMSRTEITMRLLSAEAQIQLQQLRKGQLRDDDWAKLAHTSGRLSDAPLFIDDSPNMSLMEIRSKCRRLRERHNLKLVVIDYLQLMSSGKRVESRQQEVSEFSRALKLLAKELEVPVIAISQLNRGPEQRTDKRPMMSDLRESGCLTADTRVLRADTGVPVSLGSLFESGEREVPVWCLDDSLRYVARPMTHVFSTGVKPVFRLTLASGKTIRATENHPFLTYDGWQALGDLRVGARVAVPRHTPAPEAFDPWDDDDAVRLAALSATCGTQFTSVGSPQVNPDPKVGVPAALFHASKREIGLFLRQAFALAGSVSTASEPRVMTAMLPHRRTADDVALLLLRFGISVEVASAATGFQVTVSDPDSQRRLLEEIGVAGDGAQELLAELSSRSTAPMPSVASQLGAVAGDDSGSLGQVATTLQTAELDLHAINDVLWDAVSSIELDGVEEVFDATVVGGHNFIADGIAVHNSIEQDADVVILLHRDDAVNRESERAGEADLIVAKHRNGPTDTITVAFQGHFARFTNMAKAF